MEKISRIKIVRNNTTYVIQDELAATQAKLAEEVEALETKLIKLADRVAALEYDIPNGGSTESDSSDDSNLHI